MHWRARWWNKDQNADSFIFYVIFWRKKKSPFLKCLCHKLFGDISGTLAFAKLSLYVYVSVHFLKFLFQLKKKQNFENFCIFLKDYFAVRWSFWKSFCWNYVYIYCLNVLVVFSNFMYVWMLRSVQLFKNL